jgi:preprotein translocase subunit YajC
LREGDNVVTLSGIHGTIKKLKEDVVTLQIADNVRVKIERSAIGKVRGTASGGEAKKDKDKEKDKDKDEKEKG